ncbi:hypothetical protein F4779DRAFT_642113 [Xylariaceae sp. FL0662B]|nr:hypothetical protein F4779DRAFT_642113 [Xylariaceae sp. FL0662B]
MTVASPIELASLMLSQDWVQSHSISEHRKKKRNVAAIDDGTGDGLEERDEEEKGEGDDGQAWKQRSFLAGRRRVDGPARSAYRRHARSPQTTARPRRAAQDEHGSSSNTNKRVAPTAIAQLVRDGLVPNDVARPKERLFRALCDAKPVRRVDMRGKLTFTLNRPCNLVAALVQITGAEADPPCTQCSQGFGMFHGCITPQSTELRERLQGTCANHYFNSQGVRCSFHLGNRIPAGRDRDEHVARERRTGWADLARERTALQDRLLGAIQTLIDIAREQNALTARYVEDWASDNTD